MTTVIAISGTPSTGKTTIANKLASKLANNRIIVNISKFAIDNDCSMGYDEQLKCEIIDQDLLEIALNNYLTINEKKITKKQSYLKDT